MALSKTIAPHLPYLRRYARALAGTQASGDAYVVSTLEALVADPATFPRDLPPRLGLYKVFARIWNSVAVNVAPEPDSTVAERRLEAITPRSRQAFLLTAVEQFSVEEAGVILDADEDEVNRLLDEAGRTIAEQISTDVLIIEDEPIISMNLEELVEDLGHRVMSVARTRTEALAAVSERQPGLILADIQLADGSSGLDAVNDMLDAFEAPVIFVTAYPQRLLTGERPEPTFLITKPFQPDTVKAVISQALFFDQRAHHR